LRKRSQATHACKVHRGTDARWRTHGGTWLPSLNTHLTANCVVPLSVSPARGSRERSLNTSTSILRVRRCRSAAWRGAAAAPGLVVSDRRQLRARNSRRGATRAGKNRAPLREYVRGVVEGETVVATREGGETVVRLSRLSRPKIVPRRVRGSGRAAG